MLETQADERPAWARIAFPAGWSSGRVQALTLEDFSQIPEEERQLLWAAIRKFPFSSEYTKFSGLKTALVKANERPLTPPTYIPSGWTVEQAKVINFDLLSKLSEEEHHLWAAGQTADDVRRTRKRNQLPTSPPDFIPAGWTTEQAICPGFELLSQLSKEDLTRFMTSRNEANHRTQATPQQADVVPSPLVETLARAGFPPWGFVIVRTYYGSESRWKQFQEKFDAMCDEQLNSETGNGLEKVKETLEFKLIEDSRLEDVSVEEARRHFHIAKSMGGVAAGLDMAILLLGDATVVDSVLSDGTNGNNAAYFTVVDVTGADESKGYRGHFKVSIDSLLCELYTKLSMGLSPRDLWSMIDEADDIWAGDDV
ncbi:uncharacterized protein GGS22DRAFT_171431 [Annulohypoxylon maeteangense]|uniref:uncharacterized protein n=1 Tax=Annulohypoxylon maeteangense TaxID=1927788 RepID=UPI002007BDE8|nr:uncharacterized protein GGS22DRAFT_171431 [Annulohypoxylon maeteangense]KAI0882060.1 hypothetical protein GGS22DRAFT_171431 [Annulohypoxylon maeteangense]